LAAFPEFSESKLHNPVLAYENGEEFLKDFYLGAEGQLDPFILIIEGSIPNELNKSEGYWASMGIGEVKWSPRESSRWSRVLAARASSTCWRASSCRASAEQGSLARV